VSGTVVSVGRIVSVLVGSEETSVCWEEFVPEMVSVGELRSASSFRLITSKQHKIMDSMAMI
jgi:hypothetical protein